MLSGESTPDFTDFFSGYNLPNFELSPPSPSTSSCLSSYNKIANKLAIQAAYSIAMEKIVTKNSATIPPVNSSLNPCLTSLTHSDLLTLAGLGQSWERGGSGLDTPPISLGHLDTDTNLNFSGFGNYFDLHSEDSINLRNYILDDDLNIDGSLSKPTAYSPDIKTEGYQITEQPFEEFQEVSEDVTLTLPTFVEDEVSNVEEYVIFEEPEQEQASFDCRDLLTISAEDLAALGQYYAIEPLEVDVEDNNLTLTTDYSEEVVVATKIESFKAPSPSSTKARAAARAPASVVKPTGRQRRPSALTKDSEDYRDKRDRNNASVRKSRDKARQKQEETEGRVDILASENARLTSKVDSLEKELSILRSLFKDAGTLPSVG